MWIVGTSFLRAIQMSIKIKPLLSVYVEKTYYTDFSQKLWS